MHTRQPKPDSKSKLRVYGIAFGLVLLCAAAVSAASYARITLKELTSRAKGIVEVEVLARTYPPLAPGQTFPRTLIDLKVTHSFKGALGERIVLDTPGGINGDVISAVPDAPDFKVGERAIVFIKEPQAGHFLVQDLGLGKFNIVEREGKKFVENPLCPRAIGAGTELKTQDDLDANLLTRSIPYPMFCSLVESYAAGKEPSSNPAMLAATLAPSLSHTQSQSKPELAVVADSRAAQLALQEAAETRRAYLSLGAVVLVSALLAAWIVARRRKEKSKGAGTRAVALVFGGTLLTGAILGGAGANAFVAFEQKTIWDLDRVVNGKVADNKIIWKQSTTVSVTNPDVFKQVQQSFDRWQAVSGTRLGFTNGGTTATKDKNSQDAENVIAWSTTPSDDFSQNTLAITFSSFTQGTTSIFLDGDIIFNDRDFEWGSGGFGNAASVSLHEIGHFIGLNHTTDKTTVMFPFDSGFTNLSQDENAAAVALYPGGVKPPPSGSPPPAAPPLPLTPPKSVADGSPLSGPVGTTVSFDGSKSTPAAASRPIATFEWDFGDGSTGIGSTITHTYQTVGTFTVMLLVTDTAAQFGTSTVTVQIGTDSPALKASFKLNFAALGKDTFSATVDVSALLGGKAVPTDANGGVVEGSLNIGDQPWRFTFDPAKGKSLNKQGPKVTVNKKTGLMTLAIKTADLRDVLAGHGAINDNIDGLSVPVPVTVWFDNDSKAYVFSTVDFSYFAKKGKTGIGFH